MKKIITLIAFFISLNANAGLITVDFSDTELSVGDALTISINAVDFEETDSFYFDFEFLTSMFMLDESSVSSDYLTIIPEGSFDDGLLVNTIDDIGLEFDFFDSFLPVSGNFNIASFTLTVMQADTSSFEITNFFSYGSVNDDNYGKDFNSKGINLTSQAVPEPSSVAMMMLAGLFMFSSRRKLANKTK